VHVSELQDVIRRTYLDRDRERGVDGTFRWLVEEVGELARSIRSDDAVNRAHEAGDVLAWLASVANLLDVSLEDAVGRYANGCPRCGSVPCSCPMRR
jgi:NTP pyrophosphatase (non-canonical NTP hydrolase)